MGIVRSPHLNINIDRKRREEEKKEEEEK